MFDFFIHSDFNLSHSIPDFAFVHLLAFIHSLSKVALFAILYTKEIVIYGMETINYKVYMPEWLHNGAYAWLRCDYVSLCDTQQKSVNIIYKIFISVHSIIFLFF